MSVLLNTFLFRHTFEVICPRQAADRINLLATREKLCSSSVVLWRCRVSRVYFLQLNLCISVEVTLPVSKQKWRKEVILSSTKKKIIPLRIVIVEVEVLINLKYLDSKTRCLQLNVCVWLDLSWERRRSSYSAKQERVQINKILAMHSSISTSSVLDDIGFMIKYQNRPTCFYVFSTMNE